MVGTIGSLVSLFDTFGPFLWCPSWAILESHFFFDIVHLTSFTFSHLRFTSLFMFVTPVNSIKEGCICRPLNLEA